jgi:hypothetical protein
MIENAALASPTEAPTGLAERLRALRIGYAPYSPSLAAPGDRRRFVRYARARAIPFEIAVPGRPYDLVVVASSADLTTYARVPRSTRVVFDLPDSYLAVDETSLVGRLRAPAKFLLRQHRHFAWSYREVLAEMCRRADAIVCSTPEQREDIRAFAPNVHAVLDVHAHEITRVKTDYRSSEPLHLMWEGQAGIVETFDPIREPLERLAKRRRVVLHVVTDLRYRPVNGPAPRLSTRRLLARHVPASVPTYLYEWNAFALSAVAARADLALIPMFRDRPLYWAKAENKLLLLWRLGVPVLTAATPAYVRTMKAADVDMLCHTTDDWDQKLEQYLDDETARRAAALRGLAYATGPEGEPAVLERWDRVFASVL